jgi:predicted dehydrogenase
VALADPAEALLKLRAAEFGVSQVFTNYEDLLRLPSVDAVVIATPTVLHAPIALAAIAAGKHVLLEKQLAMDVAQARMLYQAAESAHVRHMTAFTYRFVPAFRYLKHLLDQGAVGTPRFLRIARLMDWPDASLGWKQHRALTGSGELGDMGVHRFDFCHHLVGPIARVVASTRTFVPVRGGDPADVEDFASIIAEFAPEAAAAPGAVATLVVSKLARGQGGRGGGLDDMEVYGDEGTLVYHLDRPHTLEVGRPDGRLETVEVPRDFLTYPGSPRDPRQGDPNTVFRYDESFAFIQSIVEGTSCAPSFFDGMRGQAVVDAALRSAEEGRWVEVE